MKKLSLFALMLVLLIGSTGVLSINAQDDVSLVYWDTMNDQERPVMQEIIGECEAELGYEVIYEYVPFDDAQNAYRTAAQGGNAPDILRTEVAWGPEFAALGFLYDIADQLEEGEREGYIPGAFSYNTWHDRVWGLPQVTDAPALLYNKRLFEEAGLEGPPQSMEELEAHALAISALGDDIYGVTQTWGEYAFQSYMWAFGGGLIDADDLEIHINDQGTIDAFNFVLGMMENGAMNPNYEPANQYTNSLLDFKEGRAGMYINGPWVTSDVLSGPEFVDTPENLGVAAVPAGPGGQGSSVGGHGYTIYAGSPYPDDALALVRCLNTPEHQARLAKELNLVPTVLEAYDDPELAENDLLQGFLAQMQVAVGRPAIPAVGQIYTDFGPNYQAVILGDMDPQEAMDNVAEAWQALLDTSPQ